MDVASSDLWHDIILSGIVLTTTEYLQVNDTESFKDNVAQTLIFPAVRTSQGGMYTCIARVNSTGFIEEVTVNAELELFVRSKGNIT